MARNECPYATLIRQATHALHCCCEAGLCVWSLIPLSSKGIYPFTSVASCLCKQIDMQQSQHRTAWDLSASAACFAVQACRLAQPSEAMVAPKCHHLSCVNQCLTPRCPSNILACQHEQPGESCSGAEQHCYGCSQGLSLNGGSHGRWHWSRGCAHVLSAALKAQQTSSGRMATVSLWSAWPRPSCSHAASKLSERHPR